MDFPAANYRFCASTPILPILSLRPSTNSGRYAKHVTLKRGAAIFSKGDPGNSLFAVISGTVKISISSPDGRNAILNLIGAGEIFGENRAAGRFGALGRRHREPLRANSLAVDRREFIPLCAASLGLAMKCHRVAVYSIRWTSDQVEQVILQNLPGRLASALLRLTEKHKLEPRGRTIAVTQQEISEMVGMTRESINKQLRAWQHAIGCGSNTVQLWC